MDFVGKVASLLFNMLSRLVIIFLPRSKCLLISWLQSPSAMILEPPKINAVTVSTVSPSICHEVMGPDAMILVGREHSPTLQQKIGLKIYWAWLCPSEQDPVSPSVSLSHQEASISLLPFSIRGQTEWKPQLQKTNKSDHRDHSLV